MNEPSNEGLPPELEHVIETYAPLQILMALKQRMHENGLLLKYTIEYG